MQDALSNSWLSLDCNAFRGAGAWRKEFCNQKIAHGQPARIEKAVWVRSRAFIALPWECERPCSQCEWALSESYPNLIQAKSNTNEWERGVAGGCQKSSTEMQKSPIQIEMSSSRCRGINMWLGEHHCVRSTDNVKSIASKQPIIVEPKNVIFEINFEIVLGVRIFPNAKSCE